MQTHLSVLRFKAVDLDNLTKSWTVEKHRLIHFMVSNQTHIGISEGALHTHTHTHKCLVSSLQNSDSASLG